MELHPLRTLIASLALSLVATSAVRADDDDDDLWDWLDEEEDDDTTTPPATAGDGTVPAASGTSKRVVSGVVVLPLHGIELTLPPLGTGTGDYYQVSGSWRLDPDQETHAVSHVVDEFTDGKLLGGTMMQIGEFEKGCPALADEVKAEARWRARWDLWGRSWEVAGGVQVRTTGARVPTVFMCSEKDGDRLLLRRYLNRETTLPDAEGSRIKLAAMAPLEAIVQAYDRRVTQTTLGVKDRMVSRLAKSLPAARKVTLPRTGLTVDLPDDGILWVIDHDPKLEGQDSMMRAIPQIRLTSLALLHMKDKAGCEAAFEQLARTKDARWGSPDHLPSGAARWRAKVVFARDGTHGMYLCRDTAKGPLVVMPTTVGRAPDLRELQSVLEAIALAAGAEPTVNERPVGPAPVRPDPTPPRPSSDPDRMFVAGGFFMELPLSSRDTAALGLDEARFPGFNFAGPGFGVSAIYGASGAWLGRVALWASPAWATGFIHGEGVTTSPRFGAQHWEAAIEYGVNLELDEGLALGVTAGWTGTSGPITKNSSLSMSMILAALADDPEGVSATLRVTPIQLLAANERMVMSPLAAELMLFMAGVGIGAEFQYIGAPERGDQDIVAEAWAVLIRFGVGAGVSK